MGGSAGHKLFFLPFDAAANAEMSRIVGWVYSANFKQSAVSDFLAGADPLLVAYAAAHRFTVVSHELHVPGQRRKVKIPTVCGALGIACMRTFDMLRHEKAVFNL
jgi:hypothetical protein